MKNKLSESEIQKVIKQINGAMAQEGKPLTKEIKDMLYRCLTGQTTTEIERKRIIEKYRSIYG